MDNDKGKATWDGRSTEIFLQACLEQIYKKQRQGTAFTRPGWDNIVKTFNQNTGKAYDKKQLKNRFEILRREWRVWDTLMSKETGISYDFTTNKVVASDEWWQRKIQENPNYKKFRHNGLMFAQELNFIFKDVMASGEEMVAPSSTQRQAQGYEEDNVYQPTMDQQEGSGDSEEEHFGTDQGPSAGVTDEMATMNLAPNTSNSQPSGPTGSGSQKKRKRGESSVMNRKQKVVTSRAIADAVSKIATASECRTTRMKEIKNVSIDEVMTELVNIEEIASDLDLRNRCIKLMMHKTCRETFVSLKNLNRDYLIEWLRDMAYNPPSWLSCPPP